jgi:hypothetical protein
MLYSLQTSDLLLRAQASSSCLQLSNLCLTADYIFEGMFFHPAFDIWVACANCEINKTIILTLKFLE